MSTHEAVGFPVEQPSGYELLPGEPAFDPERHLALTEPESVTTSSRPSPGTWG